MNVAVPVSPSNDGTTADVSAATPSMYSVTDPVGPSTWETGATTAVKETDWPVVEGLGAAVSAVVVPVRSTTCWTAGAALAMKPEAGL